MVKHQIPIYPRNPGRPVCAQWQTKRCCWTYETQRRCCFDHPLEPQTKKSVALSNPDLSILSERDSTLAAADMAASCQSSYMKIIKDCKQKHRGKTGLWNDEIEPKRDSPESVLSLFDQNSTRMRALSGDEYPNVMNASHKVNIESEAEPALVLNQDLWMKYARAAQRQRAMLLRMRVWFVSQAGKKANLEKERKKAAMQLNGVSCKTGMHAGMMKCYLQMSLDGIAKVDTTSKNQLECFKDKLRVATEECKKHARIWDATTCMRKAALDQDSLCASLILYSKQGGDISRLMLVSKAWRKAVQLLRKEWQHRWGRLLSPTSRNSPRSPSALQAEEAEDRVNRLHIMAIDPWRLRPSLAICWRDRDVDSEGTLRLEWMKASECIRRWESARFKHLVQQTADIQNNIEEAVNAVGAAMSWLMVNPG